MVAFQQHVLQGFIYRNPQYPWMAPVGAVLIFSGFALLLRGASYRFPALASRRAAAMLFATLGTASVLLVPGFLHPLAGLLFATGIAVNLSAWMCRRPNLQDRLVRFTLPLFAGLVLVLGIFANLLPWLAERRSLDGLPAAAEGAPNVLLIILDTVRAQSLSLYGYARPTTPNLQRLASEGVVFDRAIAPAPWTLPSHASIFTGRYPHELSAERFSPLDDVDPTLAQMLARRGYATAGISANYAYADYEHGVNRGFAHWEDYPVTLWQVLYNTSLGRYIFLDGAHGFQNNFFFRSLGLDNKTTQRPAPAVTTPALRWLEKHPDRPYFLFLNYFDAHAPYRPPPPFRGRFAEEHQLPLSVRIAEAGRERAWAVPSQPGEWDEIEAGYRDRYDEAITYLDSEIGGLLEQLNLRGLLENTVVVIAADHGEEFGEHGEYEHGNDTHLTQIHVPLIISYPGHVPQGVRVAEPVTLRDLAATILDVTRAPKRATFPGLSLAWSWTGRNGAARGSPALTTLKHDTKAQTSLVTSSHHYIWFEGGEERLYDSARDPFETRDLARVPEDSTALASSRQALVEAMGGPQAPKRYRKLVGM